MGRGDKKSGQGKIWRGSHGNTRPKTKTMRKARVARQTKARAKTTARA